MPTLSSTRSPAEETAVDGQWASVFLANFHFAASGSNYLASQSPPSLLQNFWSLAVEEQFYIVYPTVFLIAARLFSWSSVRLRVGLLLGATVIGSYVLSVVLTAADPSSAFFSPFTRAWELALGGLVAVASSSLLRLPKSIAAAATWLGCGGIWWRHSPSPQPLPIQVHWPPYRSSGPLSLSLAEQHSQRGVSNHSCDGGRSRCSDLSPIRCTCGTGRFS